VRFSAAKRNANKDAAMGCLRVLAGFVIGAACGFGLGTAVGTTVADAKGVSRFEGFRGYYVVFTFSLPFSAGGALGGAFLASLRRRRGDR
jgi:hypothetical protein